MQGITGIFMQQIEKFLADTGMSPAEFGAQAVNDRNFVSDLRNGRAPTLKTADKVVRWMDGQRKTLAEKGAA